MSILRGAGESRLGGGETGKGAETGSAREVVMEGKLRRKKQLSSILQLVGQRGCA